MTQHKQERQDFKWLMTLLKWEKQDCKLLMTWHKQVPKQGPRQGNMLVKS